MKASMEVLRQAQLAPNANQEVLQQQLDRAEQLRLLLQQERAGWVQLLVQRQPGAAGSQCC